MRRVIADFVLNFVTMATRVGRGRICLASFNSTTPKIHKDLGDNTGCAVAQALC